MGGAKLYDGEKAWSSVNYSILSGFEEEDVHVCVGWGGWGLKGLRVWV